MLIDTHCHLEMGQFDKDREDTIRRALDAGVGRMLTVGTNLADCRKVLDISAAHRQVYCSVGIHPHDSREATDDNLEKLQELAKGPKVLALGEIGLDFFKNYAPRDVQIAAFESQLDLAAKLDLPIVIHDRDAHDEIIGILKTRGRAPYRGVFHCFSGDADVARQVLDLGFHLSFTGTITYKKEVKSHEVIAMAPRDRVMVETDCPYLTPVPYRGRRNEPAYVHYVAEKLAELWDVPVNEAARITTDNAFELFGFETASMEPKIAYEYKGNLYLNITNRCSQRCWFCAKWPDFTLGRHYLRLKSEPTVEQVIEAAGDVSIYPEVVFCGYGEPTYRLDEMLQIAKALKGKGADYIRLNTNGQGDLINGRPIAGDLTGVIDGVSVSLNAQDAGTLVEICEPEFGEKAYGAMLDFIRSAKAASLDVTASVVNVDGVDIEKCRTIAEDELEVEFRVRG